MPPRQMMDVKIRVAKRFEPHVPGQRAVLQRLGARAGRILRERVDRSGRGAERPLPKVPDRRMSLSAKDPRYAKDPLLEPRYAKGDHRGSPSIVVAPSYRRYKRAKSGNLRAGQSLSGAMWRSLTARISSRGVGRKRIIVGFSGSVVTATVPDPKRKSGTRKVRIANRDKATMLQYEHRRNGKPVGRRRFALMQLTGPELESLRDRYLKSLRLFRGRSRNF